MSVVRKINTKKRHDIGFIRRHRSLYIGWLMIWVFFFLDVKLRSCKSWKGNMRNKHSKGCESWNVHQASITKQVRLEFSSADKPCWDQRYHCAVRDVQARLFWDIQDAVCPNESTLLWFSDGLFGFSRTTKAKHGKPTYVSSPNLTLWKTSGRKYIIEDESNSVQPFGNNVNLI